MKARVIERLKSVKYKGNTITFTKIEEDGNIYVASYLNGRIFLTRGKTKEQVLLKSKSILRNYPNINR